MADPLRPDDSLETPDPLAAAWLAAEDADPDDAEPAPDLPDDGFPPLDDAFLDQLDRDLDALARGAGPRPQPPAGGPRTGRNRPYAVHQVPILRQQWNPRLRRHPDWPEEWFVRVPGTAVTWSRRDLEQVARTTGARPAPQLVSFPTAAAAEQFAQAVWRRRWRRVLAEDAVVNPIRQHYFTCDPDHPEDLGLFQAWQAEGRLPVGVVLHTRRLRLGPATPPPRPASADDPAEPFRQQWDLPRPAASAPRTEPPWHPWEAQPGQWALVRWEGGAPAFWRTASGRPGLFALPPDLAPDAAAEALQRRLPAGVPCAPRPGTPGADQAGLLRQALRDALRAPTRPDSAVDRWLADGRLLLIAARGLAREAGTPAAVSAYAALEAAAAAAVERVQPATGLLPASPEGFRSHLQAVTEAAQALARVAGAPDPSRTPLAQQALAWRAAGEALTADALGLFASGRSPDALVAPVVEGVHALANDPGTLALADRAEEFATRLPNGQWIRWAAEPPWGDAARAATPDAYQPSLAALPEPRWVDPHAYPDLDTVRTLAAEHGAALTVLDHPGAVAGWEAAVTRRLGPEAAAAVIQAARTPQPDLAPPAAAPEGPEPPAPRTQPAPWTFYVSPWDHHHLVVWARSRDGRVARPAAEDPKTGTLRPLDGRRKADRPLLLAHDGAGLPAVLARAQARWPALQPADVPEAVAKRLVDRHGIRPGVPVEPADALWRVSVLPGTGTAFAWTREITATRETGRDGPYWRVRQTEAVLVDAATRAPWTLRAADDAAALREAVATLERRGLAAVPVGREAPKFAVDQVVADPERLRIPARRAPAPPDPFATFAALERSHQEAVLATLPEPLNRRVVQGAYGLTPREVAQASRILVDVAARQLRQAERALADYFAQHPEVRPPKPAPAAAGPEAAAPRPAGPRPALGL